jgi:pSer/pThr/pTyr-binding forkhead associated (FHA) protein
MWILQRAKTPAVMFLMRPGAVKTVGRAPRADFRVEAAVVSRLHCRLRATEDTLEVEDLKSTNGTFVNDRRVERAGLTDGDRLRVGRVELTVEKAGRREKP